MGIAFGLMILFKFDKITFKRLFFSRLIYTALTNKLANPFTPLSLTTDENDK